MSLRITADWLHQKPLQDLLQLLNSDGEEARIAGGAVRNALLGQPVADVDIATTCRPEEVTRRAERAGLRTVPTGMEHGTVTVIAGGVAHEVTTLRKDIATDGRRATVRFGRDWRADASRRDFTINGLYAEADGTVIDHVGGIADLEARRVRFIGVADDRIREDYLRILRFFRFFAWYGAGRPDAEGLKSCARLKNGLAGLSAERVWTELRRTLAAPDPGRALLWMRQTGVLTQVLPESEKWGIDTVSGLIQAEHAHGWSPDPLLRLAAMVPPREDAVAGLSRRLKLSGAQSSRLLRWAQSPAVGLELDENALLRLAYRSSEGGISDRLRLAIANEVVKDPAAEALRSLLRLLERLEGWERPRFPVTGKDLARLGMQPGVAMGQALRRLEQAWIDADFALTREELLSRASAE